MHGPDWFDDAWTYRAPFLVVLGGASNNINHPLPVDLDEMWTGFKADADDLRLTNASSDLVPHKLSGYATSPRGGTVQAQNLSFGGASVGCGVMWLYWGNSDAPTPGAHSPEQTSLRTTTQATCLPARVSRAIPFRSVADGLALRETVRKGTAEDKPITFDVTDVLCRRQGQRHNRQGGGGLSLIVWGVEQGGDNVSSMVDLSAVRYLETAKGRHLVTVRVKAGTDGQSYTGILTLTTTDGAVFEHRILIAVADLTEA
jgi:hypothetical protein